MNIAQLSELCELPAAQTAVCVGKLLSMKYIRREHLHPVDAFADSFSIADGTLEQDLEYIGQDCRSVIFKGMTDEEKDAYAALREKINGNILSYLAEENRP